MVAEAALEADGELAEAQRALGLSTSEFYRRHARNPVPAVHDRPGRPQEPARRDLLGKASGSTAT